MSESNFFKMEEVVLTEDILGIERISIIDLNEFFLGLKFKEEYFEERVDIKPNLFHRADGIHGVTHAERVLFLALTISHMENIDEEDREIIIAGAKYHDIGRSHDTTCFDHGYYSYVKIKKLGLLNGVSFEEEELIKYIIENHCIDDDEAYENVKNYDLEDIYHAMRLLDILKDADNLDRVRINDLDVSYLRTNSAKELVAIAYGIYENKILE